MKVLLTFMFSCSYFVCVIIVSFIFIILVTVIGYTTVVIK